MRVKCLKCYFDLGLDRYIDGGEELSVNNNRANVLINAGVVDRVITPTTTKKVAKKAPDKKRG